jgi:Protein of unknown function (DUF2510)
MTRQLPPAGWYPDPAGGGRLRYFNGSTWTDNYSQPPGQMAAGRQFGVYPGQGGPQDFDPEKHIADLERRLAEPLPAGRDAEISRARQRTTRVVVRTVQVLALLGVAVFVFGIAGFGIARPLNGVLISIGLALFGGCAVVMAAIRRHTKDIRWQEGTVTFRAVEPGSVDESGQLVVCEVELNPTGRITRVKTNVGPMDTQRLVVGATMRCLIDRYELIVLRAFPYAEPDALLPSGRELKFSKAKAKA